MDKLAVIVSFQSPLTFFPPSSILADTCMKFVMLEKFCVLGTMGYLIGRLVCDFSFRRRNTDVQAL